MFSKLIKKLFNETTNIADTSSVTFNSSGTYNPRYGKQHVSVSGKAQDGSVTPGYSYDNSYSYNATGTYASTFHPAFSGETYGSSTQNIPAHVAFYSVADLAGWVNYSSYTSNIGSAVPQTPHYAYQYGADAWTGYSENYALIDLVFTPPPVGNAAYASAAVQSTKTNYVGYYHYAWTELGNSFNYTVFVPGTSGTYNPSSNTGTAMNAFGVTFPGGYGTTAATVSSTPVSPSTLPKFRSTPLTVTVPSGGYVTVTFKI